MVEAELDQSKGILLVRPSGPLSESDFEKLAALADPFIEQHGRLSGLLLQVERFPGWENFSGMIHHFRFVRDHHRKIDRVAIVTDAPIGKLAESVGSHFVAATVKHFSSSLLDEARAWLAQEKTKG